MDVEVKGFKGGDRITLGLPEVQSDLIKTIYSLGKPVVLVLLNGSAVSINWEKENIPAILEAWYPGQAAGTAIADILLAITILRDVCQSLFINRPMTCQLLPITISMGNVPLFQKGPAL